MSKRDEQMDKELDQELKQALEQVDIPPPAADARRRAITQARAAFDTAQAEKAAHASPAKKRQGFFHWLRLIVGKGSDKRRQTMDFSNRQSYAGIAAFATVTIVAVIGIPVMFEQADRAGYAEPAGKLVSPATVIVEEEILGARPVTPSYSFAPKPKAKPKPGSQAGQSQEVALAEMADMSTDDAEAPPPTRRSFALEETIVTAMKRVETPADAVLVAPEYYQESGRDDFTAFEPNRVHLVSEQPVSTFSADVDTASYSFVRRMLNSGVLPQGDAVRAEELINYFDYDYPLPATKAQPFAPSVAVSDSPWSDGRKLLHIGIKGYDIPKSAAPRSNLVFLLDVSGSMNSPDKLPLVKQSMEMLLSTLRPDDTVAIAVYAGAAGVVLEPTAVKDKGKILDALRRLNAGGGTAGGEGIRLAYELARQQYDEEAVNRVILATDGDFNVGIRNPRELLSFVERQREEGIYLSVLGFGQGNYHDSMMQTLAQNGNGVAAYIDTLSEAQKVLVDEATSSLFPIAKDVKLQVEFNPGTVAEYRLIGYETRHLNREDFNNDAVDAGDIGAGHTVTAIYEFTPVGSQAQLVQESRYIKAPPVDNAVGDEYAFLKIRYKLPAEDSSRLITRPVTPADQLALGAGVAGREAGFASAVAGFAQLLKGGRYTGDYSYDDVIELALANRGEDPYGYRNEFVQLVRKARTARAMQ